MASNFNRGVVYLKPGSVEVQKIDFPTFRNPAGKTIDHGVILKVVTTNICGSDQHMVRGRTTAPAGTVLGHEITGEVIEKGRDVEYLEIGDLVSVPFNVACGRCRTCREGDTGVCLHVNSDRRRRLWICRYGRMDRRPGRLSDGALCRLQPAEASGQGACDRKNP
jgi:glutathione-independent formaldehyde dehydrogenase